MTKRISGPWQSSHNAGARLAGYEPVQDEQDQPDIEQVAPELIAVRVTNTGRSVVHFARNLAFDPLDTKTVHLTESGVRRLQGFSTLEIEVHHHPTPSADLFPSVDLAP